MIKLLVVDDQKSVHLYVEKVLSRLGGLEIRGAANGQEALALIEDDAPEILLLDMEMPRMNGLALLGALNERGIRPECVIVLSAYSEFEYARGALQGGAQDYLLKPIDQAELVEKIRAATERIRSERPEAYDERGKSTEDVIGDIKRYIDGHYDADLSLEAVTAMFFISKFQISRLFKRQYGINYHEYVLRVRMEAAAALLRESSLKLYEICARVGFDQASYFSSSFKKYYGISPREYRRSAEN